MNNRWLKLIKSLQQKKYRKKEGLFIVQGEKNVVELLNSEFTIKALFYSEEFENNFSHLIEKSKYETAKVTSKALQSAGTYKSSDAALAVVYCNESTSLFPENELVLVLDDVRDPGNLGTIIRIADWYGINKIICSNETADLYNPKVIAATMGSFTRVNLYYCNLTEYFNRLDKTIEVFGAVMDGVNIHSISYPKSCVLVMGNESNGISNEVLNFISKKITIPKFGSAESLNVAIATSIISDCIRNK